MNDLTTRGEVRLVPDALFAEDVSIVERREDAGMTDALAAEVAEGAAVLPYLDALHEEAGRLREVRRMAHNGPSAEAKPRLLHDTLPLYERNPNGMSRSMSGQGTMRKSQETLPTPEGDLGRQQEHTNRSLDARAREQWEWLRG